MPRHNVSSDDDIVFEDLHGVTNDDDTTMEVDLDAEGDTGITRKARTSSDEGDSTGDEGFDDIDYGTPDKGTVTDDDNSDEGDGDDTGDRFSKKFENRLKREQRAKRKERDAREKAERENARLRKQLKKSRESDSEDAARKLDRDIETVETDLEAAVEAGDSKKQVRLTSQLTDLKAEKIAQRYTTTGDDDDDLDGGDGDSGASRVRNELVDEWKDSHGDWYGRRGFERQTRIANRIDREVYNDGFSPDDEEYFEELNRRLKEKMPDILSDEGDSASNSTRRGNKQQRRDKGRTPVAAADDSSRDSAPRGNKSADGKVHLGQAEFQNMRRFGLDPSNPAHVREYALSKRQADAEEADRGR